jgi:hypothetical protein
MSKKTKKSIRFGWGFYVCIMGGIFGFSILFDLGDGILVAGLECGAGFALGFGLFYIGTYLHLPGCYVDEKPKDDQVCETCSFADEAAKGYAGVYDRDGKLKNNDEIKTLYCHKKKEAKSANEPACKDWKPKQ